MKTNPENPQGWPLPAELPPAFELSQQFRESLPDEVQQWLASVEKRIDGMTLERIDNEAEELVEEELDQKDTCLHFALYQLGRRLFYTRCQQIVELMFPQEGIEFGVDLLWPQDKETLPGGAVSDAVMNGEGINTRCLKYLKEVGFAVQRSWL
jgi:hypothetical protein